jgi:hypothetical protein
MRLNASLGLTDRPSSGGGHAEERGAQREPGWGCSWLKAVPVAIWIGLLLSIVAYVTFNGEAAISEFDALDLSAYSTAPP